MAKKIHEAITANVEAMYAGKAYNEFNAEQCRLWDLAKSLGLSEKVNALIRKGEK